jgi:hypothetical protein
MTRNRKKRKQKNATVIIPPPLTVSLAPSEPRTKRKRLLSAVNTNLGGNIVGGILVLLLTLGISYHQSRTSAEAREREKRDLERVALTNEISPWLIRLYVALRDFASPDFIQESDSSLTARTAQLRQFGFDPETPVLAARISEAFGDSIRDVYLNLLQRNQEVEYAVRLAVEMRGWRPTAELRQAAKRGGWTLHEWDQEKERKLQESVPAQVDTIIVKAYRLGEYLRATTFGPQPVIFQ